MQYFFTTNLMQIKEEKKSDHLIIRLSCERGKKITINEIKIKSMYNKLISTKDNDNISLTK